ncbi:MAG: DNA polymerase I [Pelagibacterales bacterium]|nr:DNA polymerase I [Pelagibacterales bacterium]
MILADKNRDNFILVDGSSYLYRAYYALPHFTNSKGLNTGAIFGVINMISKLLKSYQPKYLCVIFDARGKNFRHRLYKEYKSNRKSMPPELSEQVPPIIDFIKSLGISVLQVPDVEADDVIGTLSSQPYDSKNNIIISSGDKDLAQLVRKNVTLINSMDDKILDIDGVISKFGVPPKSIFDYLVLVGDKSDNIPGVDKVGPKTALSLLKEYGDLDKVLANINNLSGRLKDNFSNSLEKIEIAKKLIKLKIDVDIDCDIEKYIINKRDEKKLSKLVREYELKTIADNLSIKTLDNSVKTKSSYKIIKTKEQFSKIIEKFLKAKIFSFDTETTSLDAINAKLVGVSLCMKSHESFYIPFGHDDQKQNIDFSEKIFFEGLKKLLSNTKNTIIGQNIKYDMNVLEKYGLSIDSNIQDTMILSYILNSSGRHDLDTLSNKYLNHKAIAYEEIVGSGAKQKKFSEIDVKLAAPYACEDADLTFRLYNYFLDKLSDLKEQYDLYKNIELPLIHVIARIEKNGVLINTNSLKKQSLDLAKRIKSIEENVYSIAGKEFNIGSPKQIQEIFYEDLKLPILKKTPKGQPSTNEDVMQELSLTHELPKLILQYRNLMKLKNTYTDRLGEQINESTNRLHTSYNQTVTITGRLSSSNPNLQNIPIKTNDGKNIRKTFIAEKNYQIVSADYSQIELRVMAHLSKDKSLIKSFKNGEDIHSATAQEVFMIKGDPTEEQRRAAKTINFGLIYGISSYGLSRQLKIDNNAAKDYINNYFEKYKGVKKFMDSTKTKTKEHGYISTISGRRIYLPNITHNNFQIRSAAERTAINAPIQGTAADILKIAMINIDKWIITSNSPVRMIMQVHDELVFEIRKDFIDKAKIKINDLMTDCFKLSVPLIVDICVGDNWDKAHK